MYGGSTTLPQLRHHHRHVHAGRSFSTPQAVLGIVLLYMTLWFLCSGMGSMGAPSGHHHEGRIKPEKTASAELVSELISTVPGPSAINIQTDIAKQWDGLLAAIPKVDPTSEAWVTQQAQLYKHLWRMRQFSQYAVGEVDQELVRRMERDLVQYVEKEAFDFMMHADPEEETPKSGIDLIADFSRNNKHFNETRGIVVLTGNTHCRFLLHFIATLRYVVNSTIPVEVFYKGDDDLTLLARRTLELFPKVVTKDLLKVNNLWNDDQLHLRNATFALKPFALLASEFEEPILCDADTIFLQDPSLLYEDSGYRKTGTLFYHDRHWQGQGLRKWLRTQFEWQNLRPSSSLSSSQWWTQDLDSQEQDSGVVLINKGREDVLFSAMFIAWLNGIRQRDFMASIIYGDKETFWLAFELTHQPYSWGPRYAGACGQLLKGRDTMVVDNMLHFDEQLEPLWLNGGLLHSKHKRGSKWLEVDVYGYDDGEWVYGYPLWSYTGAKWIASPKFSHTIKLMTTLAKEVDRRYKPAIF